MILFPRPGLHSAAQFFNSEGHSEGLRRRRTQASALRVASVSWRVLTLHRSARAHFSPPNPFWVVTVQSAQPGDRGSVNTTFVGRNTVSLRILSFLVFHAHCRGMTSWRRKDAISAASSLAARGSHSPSQILASTSFCSQPKSRTQMKKARGRLSLRLRCPPSKD